MTTLRYICLLMYCMLIPLSLYPMNNCVTLRRPRNLQEIDPKSLLIVIKTCDYESELSKIIAKYNENTQCSRCSVDTSSDDSDKKEEAAKDVKPELSNNTGFEMFL